MEPRRARRQSARARAAPHHGLRLLSAQQPRARRTAHGPPRESRGRPGARAPVAGARTRGRARNRGDRAATRIPGQRPPRRDAGRRGAELPRPLRRACRHAGGRRDDDGQRLPRGARARAGRYCDRGDRRPPGPGARGSRRCRARRGHRGPRRCDRARHAGRTPRLRHRHRRQAPRLRPRADVSGPCARGAPLLAVARAAHMERRRAGFCPVSIGRALAPGRRGPRRVRPRGRARGRRSRGTCCGARERTPGAGDAVRGERRQPAAGRRGCRGYEAGRHAVRRHSWISRTT